MENSDERDMQRVIETMIPISDELKDKLENKTRSYNDDVPKQLIGFDRVKQKCINELNSKQTWIDACKYYEKTFGVRIHPSRYMDEYKNMYKYNRQVTDYDGYNIVPRSESDVTTYTEPYVSDLDILFAYLVRDKPNTLPEKTQKVDFNKIFTDYYKRNPSEKIYNKCRQLFGKFSQTIKNLVK